MVELALGFLPFALSSSITPGPNNMMLAASGVNFGYRRTLPHLLGINVGFPLMVMALGWGLGEIFRTYPELHEIVKYLGAAYMLYLAWHIATAAAPDSEGKGSGKPLSLPSAAAFQLVNPKAWTMAIGAITAYTTVGGDVVAEVAVLAAVFCLVGLFSSSAWVLTGMAVGRFLKERPRALMAFNYTMGALLVASIVPFFVS